MTAPSGAEAVRPRRIDVLDAWRGVALVAMALYHGAWDLSFLQLIATDIGFDPAWRAFARLIAGSFLALVGVSLVLAHGTGVRWRPFLRRLALVAGAALAITVATRIVTPERYIFFGILHCIAASSVLALPFLRLPVAVVGGAAVAVFAAPLVVDGAVFDAPLLAWLGLGREVPSTNDYVPLFPWFGAVLLGIATARLARSWLARQADRRVKGPVARGLAAAGRHSLLVYLVHQPALLAVLYPLSLALGPNPAAEVAPFLRSCEASCRRSGYAAATCPGTCACVVDGLKAERDLWRGVLADRLSGADEEGVRTIARRCYAGRRDGEGR